MNMQEFDVSKYLDDEEIITEYLKSALEENDTQFFMQALGNVAKARGMTQISKDTGLGRASLYKAVSGNNQPKLATVNKILHAVGLSLTVEKTAST
ncbi:MAG: putative addiction module antidote protein [Cycloclasticus sp.]|nr:MAG: putative addiction module antidote protein [Cycloclasticus sp.]